MILKIGKLQKAYTQNKVKKNLILMRFDVGGSNGLGHARRCIAISELLLKKKVVFCTNEKKTVDYLINRKNYFFEIKNKKQTEEKFVLNIANKFRNSILLIDKYYCYSKKFIYQLNKLVRVVMIYNSCQNIFESKMTLFPSVFTNKKKIQIYKRKKMNFFHGKKYLIINNQVRNFKKSNAKKNNYIAITTGGSDPHKVSINIIKILKKINLKINILVLYGIKFKYLKELKKIINKSNVKIICKPFNYFDLFNCQLAISTFGTTTYELIFQNVPFLSVSHNKTIAETSKEISLKFSPYIDIGYFKNISKEKLENKIYLALKEHVQRRIIKKQKVFFDGKGINRICKKIEKI